MNHFAKFDAASFILSGEIRNHTNTDKNKLTTKSKRYIPTCLSACGDNQHVAVIRIKSLNLNFKKNQNIFNFWQSKDNCNKETV